MTFDFGLMFALLHASFGQKLAATTGMRQTTKTLGGHKTTLKRTETVTAKDILTQNDCLVIKYTAQSTTT